MMTSATADSRWAGERGEPNRHRPPCPGIRSMVVAILVVVISWLAFRPGDVQAHASSSSPIEVTRDGAVLRVHWEIALRDLALVVALDGDGDNRLTWGEVRTRHEQITRHALERLSLRRDGLPCPAGPVEHALTRHRDGTYASLSFVAACVRDSGTLQITYRLFADVDADHRALLRVVDGTQVRSALLTPGDVERVFSLDAAQSAEGTLAVAFFDYVAEGIHHILVGFDHLAFLLALLLAALWPTAAREPAARSGADRAGDRAVAPIGIGGLLAVVTAFTVAHSITLGLAVLQVVTPPPRWVESAIAASVIVAALNNVWPVLGKRLWLAAFVFGLVHGFGFASVLDTGGHHGVALAIALAGFNLGVEIGQAAILLVVLPLLHAAARRGWFRPSLVQAASIALAVLGAVWLGERLFDLRIV